MAIDPNTVKWDDAIDPAKVQWDDENAIAKKQLARDTPSLSMDRNNAFTIGAGRMLDRAFEGFKQGGLGMGAILSELLPARLKAAAQEELTKRLMAQEKEQTENTKEYAPLQAEHPIATGLGEAAPALASPMLRVAQSATLPAQALNFAASAALPAAMEYGTAEERGKRAAIAGVSGAVAAPLMKVATAVGGKLIAPIASRLSPEEERLASMAADQGIDLTAGQKTGNKFLQTVESVMEQMPATSGAQTALRQGQREAFTKNIMDRLGGGEATPDALAAAKSRVGGDFERIFSKVNVPLDDAATQTKLAAVVKDAMDTLPGDTASVVAKRVDQLIGKVNESGEVPGKAYQAWRSQVQKQAEGTSDGWLREQLRNVYRSVDQIAYDAAEKVGEAGNLSKARGQYRDIMTISPLVDKSIDGTLSPGLLLNAANKSGTQELKDAGRVGKAFLQEPVGNSGTAQRAMAQALLSGGSGLGLGGAAWAATGDPMTGLQAGLGGLAGSVAAPKAFQAIINSGAGQKFLTGGFRRELTPLEKALMERAARVSAASSGRALSE